MIIRHKVTKDGFAVVTATGNDNFAEYTRYVVTSEGRVGNRVDQCFHGSGNGMVGTGAYHAIAQATQAFNDDKED